MTNSINKHLWLKISYTHNTNLLFYLKFLLIQFTKTKLSQKYILLSHLGFGFDDFFIFIKALLEPRDHLYLYYLL